MTEDELIRLERFDARPVVTRHPFGIRRSTVWLTFGPGWVYEATRSPHPRGGHVWHWQSLATPSGAFNAGDTAPTLRVCAAAVAADRAYKATVSRVAPGPVLGMSDPTGWDDDGEPYCDGCGYLWDGTDHGPDCEYAAAVPVWRYTPAGWVLA